MLNRWEVTGRAFKSVVGANSRIKRKPTVQFSYRVVKGYNELIKLLYRDCYVTPKSLGFVRFKWEFPKEVVLKVRAVEVGGSQETRDIFLLPSTTFPLCTEYSGLSWEIFSLPDVQPSSWLNWCQGQETPKLQFHRPLNTNDFCLLPLSKHMDIPRRNFLFQTKTYLSEFILLNSLDI